MFFGLKRQISEFVREDGVCSSTLAEEQQQRDDCRERFDEKEIRNVSDWDSTRWTHTFTVSLNSYSQI